MLQVIRSSAPLLLVEGTVGARLALRRHALLLSRWPTDSSWQAEYPPHTPPLPVLPRSLAAACVAALPRVNGDGASWSALAQRLLATSHALLDVLLLGLDDRGLVGTARWGV